MIVISDTTPIISLLKLNRLDLLKELFGTVFVPQSVLEELTINEKYSVEAEMIFKSEFIETKSVFDATAVNVLMKVNMLDRGESEAIVLFCELNAEILLMDERRGREIAQKLGINLSGTLGILMKAFDKGLLNKSEILNCLNELQKNNRQISENLISRVKIHIGL